MHSTLTILKNEILTIRKLNTKSKEDENLIIDFVDDFFVEENPQTDMSSHIKKYFVENWLGWACFNTRGKVVGYCFIKRPKEKPETTTVVRRSYRGIGLSYKIRDFAINDAKMNNLLVGNVIYSACHKDNIPSLVSLLRSGYKITKLSESDNHLHLEKDLN